MNATTIVAIAALVFAMAGGAVAASSKKPKSRKSSGVVITSTKQISSKVLKQLKGALGPAGPEGKLGPAGKDGVNGKDGLNGLPGKDGTNGSAGTDGKSVTVSGTAGGCGSAGGVTVEVEGSGTPHEVCNGQTGYTDVLPSGKSEYGHWVISHFAQAGEGSFAIVSFPIPLPGPVAAHVIYLGEGEGEATPSAAITSGECKGTYKAPGAKAGNFCLFEQRSRNMNKFYPVFDLEEEAEADRYGTSIRANATAEGRAEVIGSWAVTAE
ncbi:MAG: hypothetical protein ACTHM1_05345 [Solirubrobacteraceae bacterium]